MLPARLPKSRVPHYYRFIAPMHDVLAFFVERKARRRVLQLANVQDGETVLEVAVGTGLSFRHLANANPSGLTHGIDATPEMLRRAERRMAGTDTASYSLGIGDAYVLDYPDDSIDLLVNGYMLDLLPISDFSQVLSEYARVVKPGGRIVLHYLALPTHWYHNFWDVLYRIHPFFLGGCRGISVREYLSTADLVLDECELVSQMTFPTEILICHPE